MSEMMPDVRVSTGRVSTGRVSTGKVSTGKVSSKRISSKRISSKRISSKRIPRNRMSSKRMSQIATRKMSNKIAKRIGRSLVNLTTQNKYLMSRNMPIARRTRSNIARKKANRTQSSINIIADRIAQNKRTIDDSFSLAALPPEYIHPSLPVPPPIFPDPSFPVPPPLFPDSSSDDLYSDDGKRQKIKKKSPKGSDSSDSGDSDDSEAFIKGIITRKVPVYSVTSDHKPVFMVFYLKKAVLILFSYNMSFVSDLGPLNPYGSEKFLLEQIQGPDRREYWKNAANLVNNFFTMQRPDIMFFQEMNDRDNILPRVGPPQFLDPDPNNFDQGTGQFLGGFQALLELLNGGTTNGLVIGPPVTTNCYPTGEPGSIGSYYRTGTFRSGEYCFVSFSVRKVMFTGEVVYPTVLTIWKNRPELGGFDGFYGNDIGLHVNYNRGDGFHSGRNFSFVRTSTGANLLNLHCPNDAQNIDTRLRPVINQYMETAITDLGGSYNELSTVIGGDFNDAYDLLREIVLTRSIRERYIYSYRGIAPRTCCVEYPIDTIDKPYRGAGDKIFVIVPLEPLKPVGPLFNSLLYYIQLFIPPPGIVYGGSRTLGFNNKKKSHKLQARKPRRYTHKNVIKHYKTNY